MQKSVMKSTLRYSCSLLLRILAVVVLLSLSLIAIQPSVQAIPALPDSKPVASSNLPPDYFFSLVLLPDTQIYSRDNPSIFNAQTNWVVANKNALNIQYVLHTGDIVDNDAVAEWTAAKAAMDILTAGGLPYLNAAGNHDWNWAIPPATANFTSYDTYFPPVDTNVYPPGSQRNSCRTFSVGGMNFVVLSINNNPNYKGASVPDWDLNWPDQANVIAWANQKLDQYHDYRAIIISHVYKVGNTEQSQWTTLWEQVAAKHGNVFLMLAGHDPIYTPQAAVDTIWGNNGNEVKVIQTDYQDFTDGGNGWLRILKFYPEQKKITYENYNPWTSSSDVTPLNTFYGGTMANAGEFDYGQQNSPSWWNTSWLYRQFVTYKASTITENLTNYPALLSLNATNFNGWVTALANGFDLRFVDEDDVNALAFDRVSFNATAQTAEIWVKDPDVVVGSDYQRGLYIYWGNVAAADANNPSEVWSDYAAVYHFNGDTGIIYDSTANNNDGVRVGIGIGEEASLVGTGQHTTTLNGSVQIPTSASLEITTANLTLEVLMKPDAVQPNNAEVLVKNRTGSPYYNYGLQRSAGLSAYKFILNFDDVSINTTTTNADFNTYWTYLVGTYDHTSMSMYRDGVKQVATKANTDNIRNTVSGNLSVGADKAPDTTTMFRASYDEIRVSAVARTQGYFTANQLAFHGNLFYYGGTNPYAAVTTLAASGLSVTAAGVTAGTISGNVTDLGGAPTAYRWLEYGTSEVYGTSTANVSTNATGVFTAALPNNLVVGTTYHFRAVTSNGVYAANGTDNGTDLTFTIAAPTVTTAAASSVTFTDTSRATLNGNVSNMGSATSTYIRFRWGYAPGALNTATAYQTVSGAGAVTATISGYTPTATVYYQTESTTGGVSTLGSVVTFSISGSGASSSTGRLWGYILLNNVLTLLLATSILIGVVLAISRGANTFISTIIGVVCFIVVKALIDSLW